MKVEAFRCDGCGATRPYEGDDAGPPAEWAEVHLRDEDGLSRPERHYCPECYSVQAPPDFRRKLANAEEFMQAARAGERSALDMAARFERERDEAREAARKVHGLRDEVVLFACEMERRLHDLDSKGGGWRDLDLASLLAAIVDRTSELRRRCRAVTGGGGATASRRAVFDEAADLGNLAMLVADVVRRRTAADDATEATP